MTFQSWVLPAAALLLRPVTGTPLARVGGAVIVKLADRFCVGSDVNVAVAAALPGPTAVTSPVGLTVRTEVLLLSHVTVAGCPSKVAVSCCVEPSRRPKYPGSVTSRRGPVDGAVGSSSSQPSGNTPRNAAVNKRITVRWVIWWAPF